MENVTISVPRAELEAEKSVLEGHIERKNKGIVELQDDISNIQIRLNKINSDLGL